MEGHLGTLTLLVFVAFGSVTYAEPRAEEVSLWKLTSFSVLSPDETLKHLENLKDDPVARDLVVFEETDDCKYLDKYAESNEVKIKEMYSRSINNYVRDRWRKLKAYCAFKEVELRFKAVIKEIGSKLGGKTIAKINEFREKALQQFKIPPGLSLLQLSKHIAVHYADESNDCWAVRGRLRRTPLGCGSRTLAACEELRPLMSPHATNAILLSDRLNIKEEEDVKWLQSYILCNGALGTLRCTPIGSLPFCEIFKFDY